MGVRSRDRALGSRPALERPQRTRTCRSACPGSALARPGAATWPDPGGPQSGQDGLLPAARQHRRLVRSRTALRPSRVLGGCPAPLSGRGTPQVDHPARRQGHSVLSLPTGGGPPGGRCRARAVADRTGDERALTSPRPTGALSDEADVQHHGPCPSEGVCPDGDQEDARRDVSENVHRHRLRRSGCCPQHAGNNACALVTGAPGGGELEGLLLGSVGFAVAARAHCPVAVAPRSV
ncbi:universal stress protein [Streptomyces sp. NPDC054842]